MMKLQRRFKDLGIDGRSARWYDDNTKRYRLEEMKQYAKETASQLQDGNSVLEVAPGPGYLSIELAKLGNYKVVGMDISQDLITIAKRNAKDAGVEGKVEFRQGNVADIPFPNDNFDFIICTAAFKNFKEPVRALNEMYRVLKENGTALIIDMNGNTPHGEIDSYVSKMSKTGLNKLFMKITFEYLRDGAYTKDEFINLISNSAFKEKRYDIKEEGIGLKVYLSK
jgi:ubiquinone/menaquinone biosynthesis C-methylase UbiE